jgi:hypothetical protein
MSLLDVTYSQLDQTVKLFDKFYAVDMIVNAGDYDVVYSYFESVCNSKNTALNFTAILFRIAGVTEEPVLTLLDYIKGKSGLEVNGIMAYYLNSIKSKHILYGISNQPLPNPSVQRNVVI